MKKITDSNVKLKCSAIKPSNTSKFVNTPRNYLTQLNRDPNLIAKKSIDQVIVKAQFLQAIYLHKAAEKQLQIKEKVCLKLIENLWKNCDTLADQLNANKIMLQKYRYYVNELTKLSDMKKIVEPTLSKIRAIYQSFSFIITVIHQHLNKIELTGLGYPYVPILKEMLEYGSKVELNSDCKTYQEMVTSLYAQLHSLQSIMQSLKTIDTKKKKLLKEYIDFQNELKSLIKLEQ